MKCFYTVRFLERAICPPADWSAPELARTDVAEIRHFRPESSGVFRPRASVRLAASSEGLHGIFNVEGELVRCTRTRYFDEVWKDSCVEFFVQPRANRGYFNFEFNCGGAFLCSYITDPTRTAGGGIAALQKVGAQEAAAVLVKSSLPPVIDPQTEQPQSYTLEFFIPFQLFSPYVGEVQATRGERWRCNFYKCAEEVRNPHWASWSPVDELNFHLPRCFGELHFQ